MNKQFLSNLVAPFLVLHFFTSCGEDRHDESQDLPETLYQGDYDEKEMESAMAEARKTLDHFRATLKSGTGSDHAVKVAIHDGDATEHFWLVDVSSTDEGFKGTLNNEPGLVSNVSFGDEINAAETDISDWLYFLDDKMHGNFTFRVMIPNMAADQAALYEPMLAPLPE